MTKFDDYDGYNPEHDKHADTKDEEQEEGFFEPLDRLTDGGWRVVLAAIAIALPLGAIVVWAFETYINK